MFYFNVLFIRQKIHREHIIFFPLSLSLSLSLSLTFASPSPSIFFVSLATGTRIFWEPSSSVMSKFLVSLESMTNEVNGIRVNTVAIYLFVCLFVCVPTCYLSKLALSSPPPRLSFSLTCVAVLCLSVVCLFQATCSYHPPAFATTTTTITTTTTWYPPPLSPIPIWHPARSHLSPSIHSPTFFHHPFNYCYNNFLSLFASSTSIIPNHPVYLHFHFVATSTLTYVTCYRYCLHLMLDRWELLLKSLSHLICLNVCEFKCKMLS